MDCAQFLLEFGITPQRDIWLREAVFGQGPPKGKGKQACSAQFLSLTENKTVVLFFPRSLIVRKHLGLAVHFKNLVQLREKSCCIQIKFNQWKDKLNISRSPSSGDHSEHRLKKTPNHTKPSSSENIHSLM